MAVHELARPVRGGTAAIPGPAPEVAGLDLVRDPTAADPTAADPTADDPTADDPTVTDPTADRSATGRVDVDGVMFDALSEAAVVDRVFAELARGNGGFVITPNVDILRQLRRPGLAGIAAVASIVVADGMPVVWASRIAGRPLPERVAGATLVHSLTRRAATTGRSVFLLGGARGLAEQAAERLAEAAPGVTTGWHYPPFGFECDAGQRAAVDAALSAARPDVVFVGLGFPKQERLIMELRQRFPATWFVGCGGGLTMAAGAVSRAPGWAQRAGLEWGHRLLREPRRLLRRYLVDDAPYAAGLLTRAAWRRVSSQSAR